MTSKKIRRVKLLAILIIPTAIALFLSLKFFDLQGGIVIAKVNGEKIYQHEVEERLEEMFKNTSATSLEINKLPKEIIEILLKDIFVQKELDRRIQKSKFTKSTQIKEKIDTYTKKLIRREYLESVLNKKISDEVVRSKYVEGVNNLSGKKEIRLKHILVKSKTASNRIREKLRAQESFEALARKYSIDKSTANNGGDFGGYTIEDSLPEEFYNTTSKMKKGFISDPVQTDYGWHIFKVADIRDAKAEPFEAVKIELTEQLKQEELREIFSKISDSVQIDILIDLKKVQDFENNAEEAKTTEKSS